MKDNSVIFKIPYLVNYRLIEVFKHIIIIKSFTNKEIYQLKILKRQST